MGKGLDRTLHSYRLRGRCKMLRVVGLAAQTKGRGALFNRKNGGGGILGDGNLRKMAASVECRQGREESRKEEMKCHLPPCLLQLIERMQGVVLGGAWAQDPVVLLSGCQPTFCTAVHHLLEGAEVPRGTHLLYCIPSTNSP